LAKTYAKDKLIPFFAEGSGTSSSGPDDTNVSRRRLLKAGVLLAGFLGCVFAFVEGISVSDDAKAVGRPSNPLSAKFKRNRLGFG
jgi:hypothetical protein